MSRDVVEARLCTNIDTGNTQTATTTCQYNDKYPITFGNRSINECQNRSTLKAIRSPVVRKMSKTLITISKNKVNERFPKL